MKKGFTLIELLAVIVILAIIALIATPIILNIINDTKKESEKVSKELYLDAVIQAIAKENLNSEFNPSICTIESDGNLLCIQNSKIENLKVEVNGTRPCGGAIFLNNWKISNESVEFTCDSPSFAKDDWLTIIANVKIGKNVYEVGEEKEVELNGEGFNNQSFTVRIANISNNEDEGCGGEDFSETACGFVVEFVDIISEHGMHKGGTNSGGWPASKMYTYVNTDIYNALPEKIKMGIKETKVISGHGNEEEFNYKSIDKLYLLSTKEIYGSASSYDTVIETRQLDYYKDKGVTKASNLSYAIKSYSSESGSIWWLRSAYKSNNKSFFYVGTKGSCEGSNGDDLGVAPAFRIG